MAVKGKVAAILNERDLVINKGSDAGVKDSMKFKVVVPEVTVTDPDTGEILGTVAKEKIRVKVVEVHPKFSVGKTYETYVVNVGGLAADSFEALRFRFLPRREVTRVRTLRSDDSTSLAPMVEGSSFVKVGDPVIEVEDNL